MIDSIKTINLDVSILKTEDEVINYIPTQLQKYYPEPKQLLYDYVIKGNKNKKSALVSYVHKDKVNSNKELLHPVLLFKKLLQRDGMYIVVFSKTVLEVSIANKVIKSTKTSVMNPAYLKSIITSKHIVISDTKNRSEINSFFSGKLLSLESLYKKCNLKLFSPPKKNYLQPILLFVLVSLIVLTTYKTINKYTSTMREYKTIKKQYETSLITNNNNKESVDKYNSLLKKLYNVQSQIEPDLYKVFYELTTNGSKYKIMDINYSNRYIRLNTLTPNGISLVKDLNNSDYLNLIQNSSITKDNMEVVNISGDIICP